MMFGGKNQAGDAALFGRANDLSCVKISRVENVLIFAAIAPLFVGKGIHTKMEETIKLGRVANKFAGRWDRTIGRWWLDCSAKGIKEEEQGDARDYGRFHRS